MRFWDEVIIKIKAGNGGDGLASFFRERVNPKGGPDGGDGGDGGSVVLKSDEKVSDLTFFSYHKNLKAENGKNGGKNKKKGRKGNDLELKVPLGIVVYEWDDKQKKWHRFFDFNKKRQELTVAKGGRGGWGNAHFVSAFNRSPFQCLPGQQGESKKIKLELKLIAEVGLIGLPNAGKSTLLSTISQARPKIAAYPFTTLVPYLGVVEYKRKRFVMADIPGLIKGAFKGKGLGDKFLRHIERTNVLVWLIDVNSENVWEDYKILKKELSLYKPGLLGKKRFLVLTKIDVSRDWKDKKKFLEQKTKEKVFAISAAAHRGLNKLLDKITQDLSL